MVWVAGGALAAVLLGALTLLAVVLVNGLGVFWPAGVERGAACRRHSLPGPAAGQPDRSDNGRSRSASRRPIASSTPSGRIFVGSWKATIAGRDYPRDVVVLERQANGDFYGVLQDLKTPGLELPRKQRPGPDGCSRPCGQLPPSGPKGSIRCWRRSPP